jgi:tRNA threonylcarbamoyladenosine modification (KEOPS) complex Cgi121 subunit
VLRQRGVFFVLGCLVSAPQDNMMNSELVRTRVHAAAVEALGARQSDRKLMKKVKEEVRHIGAA